MQDFSFSHDTLAQRVVLDSGHVVERVIQETEELGIKKPMFISTESAHDVAEKLVASLPPVKHWREVVQHVPRSVVDSATAAARRARSSFTAFGTWRIFAAGVPGRTE